MAMIKLRAMQTLSEILLKRMTGSCNSGINKGTRFLRVEWAYFEDDLCFFKVTLFLIFSRHQGRYILVSPRSFQ